MVPAHARYVIIGAGVHGLSTAWHLAHELRTRGLGEGRDVLVVDKHGVAGGASGIACGVIRNNYFQPAMRQLMAHSVSVWESDPEAFAYHPVGYLQAAPEAMRADVAQIAEEQRAIGYDSEFVEGREACRAYLRDLFDDWQAPGITAVLHEKHGGYANNVASMRGVAGKAQAEGVRFATGVRVTGFHFDGDAVEGVTTDQGTVRCDQVVIGAGPWVRDLWAMLSLPDRIDVTTPDGTVRHDRPMWTYQLVREGTVDVDPAAFTDNRGAEPPVVHVDSDTPLYDEQGELVTDQLWGIYYKPDFRVHGIQGGTTPAPLGQDAEQVAVDPYGPDRSAYVVGADFVRLWTSALAHCHKRLHGVSERYRPEPSGGIGAFSPDSFPVFDVFHHNAYVVADSNHGYKMLGVGALVAKELLGEPQTLLEPFRFSRFRTGRLHPTSNSPFPWS